MVRSVLSPEKVVGRQNTNRAAAQNFISGGSVLGSSVLNSAANKIVGFQRAGVQPAPSATGSIVSTISTNINNNVTSVINKTLQGFSTDYQKRLKQVDDAKPIGILGKFLTVYKTSLGFIQFFGNKKNIDKVRDNLEALKKSFTESFEVAKLIRQVIIKIVKQLSNLPVASPSGGGGLNLDVDIPGGGLKKSAPRGLGRMMRRVGGKGRMLALGAGALGLGAAGGAAVNALSDSPTQVQAAGTSPEIPGDIGDKFSSIVDRFANAISKLFETNKQKSKQQQSSGSSGGATKKEGKKGAPSAGPAPGETPPGSTPDLSSSGKKGVIEYAQQKGFSEQFTAGLLTQVSHESGGNPFAYNPNDLGAPSYGTFQFRAERGDQMIKYLEENGIPNAKAIFTNSKDPRRNDKQLQKKALALQIQYFTETEKDQATPAIKAAQKSTDLKQVQNAFFGGERFLGYDKPSSPEYQSRAKDIQLTYNQLHKTGELKKFTPSPQATPQAQAAQKPGVVGEQTQAQAAQKPGAQVAATPQTQVAQVEAAKTAQTQVAQRAAAVSQTAQTKPQVNYLPIDMSGGGQQQTGGGGGTSGPPPAQGNGPSVPFLPASNTDNFLVLYSRMVYNIVDG